MFLKTIFLFLFSLFFSTGFSQNLKSKLLDFERKPIEGVKVFYDNSTVSTFTNENGVFELPVISVIPDPKIVFYHPNYEIFEEPDIGDLESAYYLKEKKKENNISNPVSSLFSEEEMYKVFKENFLGKTRNTKKTKILNKEALQFEFDTGKYAFSAKASQPLQIQNNALGYHIEYYLKNFKIEYSADTLDHALLDYKFYYGYSLFKDIDSTKTKEREQAYEGTINHFFKKIIKEDYRKIKSKVFTDKKRIRLKKLFNVQKIQDSIFKLNLKNEMLQYQDDGDFIFYIQPHYSKHGSKDYYFKENGGTFYENKSSTLALYRPYILVDKYGNPFDDDYFEISGEILEIDLADRLPIEYHLTE